MLYQIQIGSLHRLQALTCPVIYMLEIWNTFRAIAELYSCPTGICQAGNLYLSYS
jgi:hypothetical protein